MIQDVCERLFQSSPGILAVGIVSWDQSSTPAFLSEPTPARPWVNMFNDAVRMLKNADHHRDLDRLQISFENVALLVERSGDWVVAVGVVAGHPVRKSLRRMVAQAFKQLERDTDGKVIPLLPNVRRASQAKDQGNLKPG